MHNSESSMNEIEIPSPMRQSDSQLQSESDDLLMQRDSYPKIQKADSHESLISEHHIQPKKYRKIVQALDIIGMLGLLTYCILIQSYYSTFYLICLLLILNYSYISSYKGVQVKDGKLYTLTEFASQQEQFHNTNQNQEQFENTFITQYWLVLNDFKKPIWQSFVVVSAFSLIVKLVLYPIAKNGGYNMMSIDNFSGLEVYFTVIKGKVTVSSAEQGLAFAPNCIMLALAIVILTFRNVQMKQEFHELKDSPILTKFFILAIDAAQSNCFDLLYQIFDWPYNVGVLINIAVENVLESIIVLMVILVVMYFISTPIKKVILQNNQAASFTLQFTGFQLFGYFSNYEAQAILFIIFSIFVLNMLCIVSEKIKTQSLKDQFNHTIGEISQQYEDFKQFEVLIKSQMDNISVDINNSPKLKKKGGEDELSDFEEEKDISDQNCDEQGKSKDNPKPNRISEFFLDQQANTSIYFHKIEKAWYDSLENIKNTIDKPLVSLIVLQILSLCIVILQQTYFSILLVCWLILTGFTLNFRIIRIATIFCNIPSLLINFFTFYYSNITGLDRPNNFYQFCPSSEYKALDELPTTVCQKLGFFYQDSSAVNSILMNCTLCLFFLFIKQIEEQEEKEKQLQFKSNQIEEMPRWFNIFLAFFFRIDFLIIIILLYWVGFNEINIISFIMILLLIIFIVNQSSKCDYRGKRIPFQQKYWIILLVYMSFLTFIKYLYILFGVQQSYFVVQIIGLNMLNKQLVLNWLLFYLTIIQYYGFNTAIYDQYSNRLIATISQVESVKGNLPNFRYHFGILETMYGHSLIWAAYVVNICFLLFTPYSYLNNLLLLYIGIVFLYHVKSINSQINYIRLRTLWYIYMYFLLIAFSYRYLFSFFCVPDLDNKSKLFQKFYDNLQLYYQEAGLYAYSTDNLRMEYLADTLNILFGAFALNQLTKFKNLQISQHNKNLGESSSQNVLDLKILDQYQWLKYILIGIAHLNTDLITIYIVISCVLYLRSIAAFILLTLYLSYFYRVHNTILDMLEQKKSLTKLQTQIYLLKQLYLQFASDISHIDEPKKISRLNDEIKLLRLTTRIKLKRKIWLYSFYFTAFCIFLSYLSQFLSTESFTENIKSPLWVDYTVLSFFIFGTYSRQYVITNSCYCGYESNNNDCQDTDYVQTESNMWQVSWFYLFLLFVNVIDTACTKILEDDLTKSIENLQETQEMNKIKESRIQNQSYEESKETFDKKYDFVVFVKSHSQYNSFDREVIILNYFTNKSRFVKILLNESLFKIFQRFLILLYLSNTLLVNTIFSLFYLTISVILFQMSATVKNTKMLNSIAIFSILFQYFLYLLNWTPSENDIPEFDNFTLLPQDFNIMAKTNLSDYWLAFLGFESTEIMDCEQLKQSVFSNMKCETNQLLNIVIVFNCLIVSFIYLYFLMLEWFCNQIFKQSIKMKNEFILCKKVLSNHRDSQIIITYNLWRQKNYSFRHVLIQTITMNYHLILFGFVLLLCEMNRSIFNLLQLLIVIGFLYAAEFHFQWPYAYTERRKIKAFYQAIFTLSAVIIALFTFLKVPTFLEQCVNASQVRVDEGSGLEFYCMEAFNLKIDGQIFLIFFISLYFDLQISSHMRTTQDNYQSKLTLRARMVSRGLAYNYNYIQYKKILQLQEEKNLLNQISDTIEQKMIIWKRRVREIQMKQLVKEKSLTIQQQQQYPQLTASFMTEPDVQIPDHQSFFRKVYIKMIIWMRNDNQSIKFMPFHILMDYILQQNKRLQRHIFITIENHLMNETKTYEDEMRSLEKIYRRFYQEIGKNKDKLNEMILDKTIQKAMEKYKKLYKPFKGQQYNKYINQQQLNYQLSKELRFVHIIDEQERIVLEQTKQKYPINKLISMKTINLFSLFLQDLFKYCIINWDTITNIIIICYYFKNYALFGMLLPITMFVWGLIDVNSKIFWMISYSLYFFIILMIFVDSMYGVVYNKSDQPKQYVPWYYVLDNSNTFGLFYEIFTIWLITFQVFLQKSFGIFDYPFTLIENIFQGYIRLKLNNFNKDMVEEIVQESEIQRSRSKSEIGRMENPEIERIEVENQLQGRSFLEKSGLEVEPESIMLQIGNDLERKIAANPEIISDKYKPGFFEKIMSYEYARPGVDLYLSIASIQVILFLYMLFFFNFMTGESQNIEGYLKYNEVPAQLVLALVFQMLFMMVERYIELRGDQKYINSQERAYVLQVLILTLVFLFVYCYLLQLWNRNINDYKDYDTSIVIYFLLFCAYFYLSALQLRYGYRELKVRNQFLYVYNSLSYYFALVLYSIPFLYDLKVLMDWTCLYTSLDIYQWFILEDIQRQMFFTKISSQKVMKRQLGLEISKISKLIFFFFVIFILICILGPLILFSALNPAAQNNPIVSGSFTINLVNVDTNLNVQFYESSQLFGLELPFLTDYSEIKELTKQQKITQQQIDNSGGIQRFQLSDFSNQKWQVSLPLYNQLIRELNQTITLDEKYHFLFNVTFTFRRRFQFILPSMYKFSYPYNPLINGENGTVGLGLDQLKYIRNAAMACNTSGVMLPNFYIEALRIYQSSATNYNTTPIYGKDIPTAQDVFLNINCSYGNTNPLQGVSNWEFQYAGNSSLFLNSSNLTLPDGLLYFVICDNYSVLTYGLSVITIYTTVILLIAKFIRSTFSSQVFMLEFTQMVQPDDLLSICQAVSVARQLQNYRKENLLYFELIDILRSPELVKAMTGAWSEKFDSQQNNQKDVNVKVLQNQKQHNEESKLKQD
ncbi:unnamed protein product (macronuclear) [Paramecium tetraurelia]|uniref:Uncharacterized protein n=1 Tax=Paramecium tetraurelia TaxID=5888 RepID=A0DB57_PARTE|nr:uncharacterized protein GSPATT00015168001 [Paramecium tetraurelia]CAK80274.1 unnamed protein product [Paramecium tetraurelia]|eukprot:XP_001447671.1 hypothetical protein (macronuclear) [Paramecium tetraurelia strain d4-2]